MSAGPLIFRLHAIKRMFQRRISEDDVRHVLKTGETIERIHMTRRIQADCC